MPNRVDEILDAFLEKKPESKSITSPHAIPKPDTTPNQPANNSIRKLVPHRSFTSHVCTNCGGRADKGVPFTKLVHRGLCDTCANVDLKHRFKESFSNYKSILREEGFREDNIEDSGRIKLYSYSNGSNKVILTMVEGKVEQWRFVSSRTLIDRKDCGILPLANVLKESGFKSMLRGGNFADILERYERKNK